MLKKYISFKVWKRGLTSAILETPSTIYKLQTANHPQTIEKEKTFLQGCSYLNIFIPRQNLSPPLEHLQVDRFLKRLKLHYPEASTGYGDHEHSFRKIVYVSTSSPVNITEQSFSKMVLKINNHNFLDCSAEMNDVDWMKETKFSLTKLTGPHPLFDHTNHVAVQNNITHVIDILQQLSADDVMKDTVNKLLHHEAMTTIKNSGRMNDNVQLKHPFIVVEGLDGTGKSTMINNLSKRYDIDVIRTPPACINSYRHVFNELPELCRRAYYYVGNYIAAEEVLRKCEKKPVLVDRYWYSTVAYAIATQSICSVHKHLPCLDHPIYKWPSDLLKPTAVVHLTIPEKTWDDRVTSRKTLTDEEKKMNVDHDFKSRIVEMYRRIRHDGWIDVDTSGTKEQSVEIALQGLKKYGLL